MIFIFYLRCILFPPIYTRICWTSFQCSEQNTLWCQTSIRRSCRYLFYSILNRWPKSSSWSCSCALKAKRKQKDRWKRRFRISFYLLVSKLSIIYLNLWCHITVLFYEVIDICLGNRVTNYRLKHGGSENFCCNLTFISF